MKNIEKEILLKFGQKLAKARLNMVIKNLQIRDNPRDRETIKLMKEYNGI